MTVFLIFLPSFIGLAMLAGVEYLYRRKNRRT